MNRRGRRLRQRFRAARPRLRSQPAAPRAGPRCGHAAVAALLALLAAAGYANAVANGFVWDDTIQILHNPGLRPAAAWRPLFTSDVWAFAHPGTQAKDNYYRPLQMLTYKAIVLLFGYSAPVFHLVNVAFHIAATVLVYFVVVQLTRRWAPAAAAAALFALHPIHTEAVDWIAALPELGCAAFFFLALLLYLRAVEAGADARQGLPPKPGLQLLSYVSFAVALLWKEMAVTLPLVIALHSWLLGPGEPSAAARLRTAARAALPYGVVLAAYLPLRYLALGLLAAATRRWVLSPLAYALTVVDLVGKYWWKLVLPLHLNAYHVFDPVRSLAEPRGLAALLFLALAATAVARGRRRHPLAAFAMSWVFVTLIPVLALREVGRNVFAERYLYIPSLGFCMLVVWLAGAALSALPAGWRLRAGSCALAVVAGLYFTQTVRRNTAWKDQFTFFTRTLQASPDSPVIENQVAALLFPARHDPGGAGRLYRRALVLAKGRNPPEWDQAAKADIGLALIADARGDYGQALVRLGGALRAWPDDPEIPSARGAVLLRSGRWQAARNAFRAALRVSPYNVNAWNGLGFIAWHDERREGEALDDFRRALQAHPSSRSLSATLQENLGAVACELGQCRRGLAHLQTALAMYPNNPVYRTNLATALIRLGQPVQARAELEKALALDPGYAPARTALENLAGKRP